jgi:hypothetical protein
MDILVELLKQGVVGLLAAVGFYLYFQERKERKEYQDKYEASLDARRVDSVDREGKVIALGTNFSQSVSNLTDKIVTGKQNN